MNEAVCGLLKDKCRILATHQLNVLHRCDRIMLLNNGCIDAIDTFENLMRDNQIFQQLMLTPIKEKEQQRQDLKQGGTKDKYQIIKASKNTTPAKGLLIQKGTALNSAGSKVWMAYISASGSSVYVLILVIAIIAVNGASLMTGLWLAYWTSSKWNLSKGQYIGIYAGLATAQVMFMYTFALVLAMAGTNASKTILSKALTRVLRAPMSFFDTTPTGHITDRLSKDIQVMDNDLTDAIRTFAVTITTVISALILIILFYYYVWVSPLSPFSYHFRTV
jgi:ABC-type multidrug transport system fused ATPase/permease subunit